MSFNIDNSIVAAELDRYLNSICETHDLKILNRWNCSYFGWCFNRRRSEAANHLVIRFSDLSMSADTDCLMISNCALCIGTTDMARTNTLTTGIALSIKWTVMIGDTSYNRLTSFDIRISNRVNGTDAFVTTRFVFTNCSRSARIGVSTQGNCSTFSVR